MSDARPPAFVGRKTASAGTTSGCAAFLARGLRPLGFDTKSSHCGCVWVLPRASFGKKLAVPAFRPFGLRHPAPPLFLIKSYLKNPASKTPVTDFGTEPEHYR